MDVPERQEDWEQPEEGLPRHLRSAKRVSEKSRSISQAHSWGPSTRSRRCRGLTRVGDFYLHLRRVQRSSPAAWHSSAMVICDSPILPGIYREIPRHSPSSRR